MNEHEMRDSCLWRFNDLENKLGVLEEKHDKRLEKDSIIEKAILEIQISSQLTAKTLAKLEEKFESLTKEKTNDDKAREDKWFKIFEKVLLILAGVIGALLGTKLL